jgi:glucose-6-phosphate isomerase
MNLSKQALWERFQQRYVEYPTLGLSLDTSRMNYDDAFVASMEPRLKQAFAAMDDLEKGAIANPDEKRMVGHYWLRNPSLAPTAEIRKEIEDTFAAVKEFAASVHSGKVRGAKGPFKNVLIIGIGGSALGPQFVSNALTQPQKDKAKMFFFDNTDPDGMDKVLSQLGNDLGQTLAVVISKSGGTKETRNGMLEAQAAYERQGLNFAQHAVAVTGVGSNLDKSAQTWIRRLPMWDWVGGRTSELSAVGLLPAALQGIDIEEMVRGAKDCDSATRASDSQNPAALLAYSIYYIGKGAGAKDMVVLPYKDRLELFSKYLQQLIMESLGKEHDVNGKVVNQGLSVYGNKGSTDQHAYVQQLRDGLKNFFVLFIEVLQERQGASVQVEPNTTAGDYLFGYYMGTRQALFESGRESITITFREVSPFTIGVLIALFERFVGLYASLIGINAYHQPGVEAGKKAADAIVDTQRKAVEALKAIHGRALTVSDLAQATGGDEETIFKICEHLASNAERGVTRVTGANPFAASYKVG